ncbi:MAG: hypothetical protein QOK15_2640, partial [Nocardioidaceae bacterium]|nr:hypothetical protein [Nocardioidaceae bacterium]
MAEAVETPPRPIRRVLITGATGYIGGRLVPELLDAGYEIRCLVRNPAKVSDEVWSDRVEVVKGDVTDRESVVAAMEGMDAAYYLVHSMGASTDFSSRDREAATTFRDAAAETGLRRIVYLGGLGRDDDPHLSAHLQSRHEVGRVLADGPVPVTELRAAVIIGSGSASFEMLRYLVEILPVMICPRWVHNRCQPIAIGDVLYFLVAVLGVEESEGQILEVGGPDILSYRDMMLTYAEVAGLRRRRIQPVPVLSPSLSSRWVGLVTPLPTGLARPLVESLINEVVVEDRPITAVIPHRPIPFREALERALARVAELEVVTSWSDATLPGRSPADPMPTDPDWAGGSLLRDWQQSSSDASPAELFQTVQGIGGARGWYVTPLLWGIRGFADKLIGGVGMRRGRRNPDVMWVGDAVDFWRVEAVEPPSLIRLRAEMKLPGEAWIEWRIEPEGSGSRLDQRAIFYPRGLLGR